MTAMWRITGTGVTSLPSHPQLFLFSERALLEQGRVVVVGGGVVV
eukprot:CAMPEP_0115065688 /NCGR_PEP_ID=MMETSP0227-20121206/10394_1 /TAXON_ID=89957 /ORGANISM="Polarella glacialis, Strain CCMP 1383" /LENGTH=44 /DNA_ID= /DNA_START= /DNA_END= /DNA_ORIENTATION=